MADVKTAYRTSTAIDTTNLDGQGSFTDFLTGWTSATYDNATNLDIDVLISGQFTVESTGVAAGQIRVYLLPLMHNVSSSDTWPDVYTTGTEGTQSASAVVRDTEILDSAFYLLWSTVTDTGGSDVYPMTPVSILTRIGFMPRKFLLYVAQSTTTTLETTGNVLYATGIYHTVA